MYTKHHTIARLNNFRRVISHTPKNRTVVFRCAKQHVPIFLYGEACFHFFCFLKSSKVPSESLRV